MSSIGPIPRWDDPQYEVDVSNPRIFPGQMLEATVYFDGGTSGYKRYRVGIRVRPDGSGADVLLPPDAVLYQQEDIEKWDALTKKKGGEK